MAYKLFTWDYKDQPPLAEILEAFQGMVDYDQVPEFVLPDTGGDYYACVVSELELPPEQVERILAGEDDPVSDQVATPWRTTPGEPGA